MKEILKSFLEVSNERIRNPLIGTFVIAWLLVNWRPIFIALFSNNSIIERIEFIESNYMSISSTLIFPLLIALFYVIILPYLMWGIDELIQKSSIGRKKNLTKQIIIDYEGKQKIAIEESKLEDLKASFREKSDLNKQIEFLRNQLAEKEELWELQKEGMQKLINENSNLNKILSSNNQLNNNQLKIKTSPKDVTDNNLYDQFSKSNLMESFGDVGKSIHNKGDFPSNINDYIKRQFLAQNIVEKIRDGNIVRYKLTNLGLSFWQRYLKTVGIYNKK